MTDYTPGEGDVAITLNGQNLHLRPTLAACMRLSRSGATGPRILADQCMALNFDAINFVVACGLDRVEEDTQNDVFLTGTTTLFGACVKFIHNVSNGGRPYKEATAGTVEDPPLGG